MIGMSRNQILDREEAGGREKKRYGGIRQVRFEDR
jgi:hypothetical protein